MRLVDFGYEDVGADDRFFLVPVRNLAEKPSDSLSAAEHFKAEEQRALAHAKQDTEQRAAVVAKEVETGRCQGDRYELLSGGVADIENIVREWDFDLVAHEVLVAKPEGATVALRPTLGGSMHVFSLSFDPVELSVEDAKGYAIKRTSDFEGGFAFTGLKVGSRALTMSSGDEAKIRIAGKGCALVVVLRQR